MRVRIKGGVSLLHTHTHTHTHVQQDLGQRAYIGKVCMDRNSPDTYIETSQGSIDDARAVAKQILGTVQCVGGVVCMCGVVCM
jgi:cytosine/adenosine deaminase-related metal-dependent hydrolase